MSEEERARYWEAGAAVIRDLGGPYAVRMPALPPVSFPETRSITCPWITCPRKGSAGS